MTLPAAGAARNACALCGDRTYLWADGRCLCCLVTEPSVFVAGVCRSLRALGSDSAASVHGRWFYAASVLRVGV